MKVTPNALNFSMSNRTPQSVTITGLLSGSWTVKATSGLLVSPSIGKNNTAFTVSFIPHHAQSGTISVTAPGQSMISIPVTFSK